MQFGVSEEGGRVLSEKATELTDHLPGRALSCLLCSLCVRGHEHLLNGGAMARVFRAHFVRSVPCDGQEGKPYGMDRRARQLLKSIPSLAATWGLVPSVWRAEAATAPLGQNLAFAEHDAGGREGGHHLSLKRHPVVELVHIPGLAQHLVPRHDGLGSWIIKPKVSIQPRI